MILASIVGMVGVVVVALAILVQFAGRWGVPFFSFATERGSTCTNGVLGYTCEPLTLADTEYYGQVDLPQNTRVVSATYASTHDYRLDASLEVPAPSAAAALKGLQASFGACVKNHISPIDATTVKGLCVMANDTDLVKSGEPDSRVYIVASGIRADGVRIVSVAIRSR